MYIVLSKGEIIAGIYSPCGDGDGNKASPAVFHGDGMSRRGRDGDAFLEVNSPLPSLALLNMHAFSNFLFCLIARFMARFLHCTYQILLV